MASPLEITNIDELERRPLTKAGKRRELGTNRRVLSDRWQLPSFSFSNGVANGNGSRRDHNGMNGNSNSNSSSTGNSNYFVYVLLLVSVLCNFLLLADEVFDDSDPVGVVRKSTHHEQHAVSMCAALPSLSSMDAWNTNVMAIHQAAAKGSAYHDLMAEILQLLSPRMLNSVKAVPRDWTQVSRIVDKAWKRYQYLMEHPPPNPGAKSHHVSPNAPPPVQIVVMGGIVPFGTTCKDDKFNTGSCAWPTRMERLINNFFLAKFNLSTIIKGHGIVTVTNVAVAATNSGVGATVLNHDVLSEETDRADIIINAYSTDDDNDSFKEALEVIQKFYRAALQPHPCKGMPSPPLMLHVNDAFGDGESPLLKSTVVAQVADVLSSYYGFASISYVDVVRDWVYGDQSEQWFSSEEHRQEPGHGMHISMGFIMAFNLLNLVTSYCTVQPWHVLKTDPSPLTDYDPTKPQLLDSNRKRFGMYGGGGGGGGGDSDDPTNASTRQQQQGQVKRMPDLQGTADEYLSGKPHSPPKHILPVFKPDITLFDIQKGWKASTRLKSLHDQCQTDSNGNPVPNYKQCPFSWISDHGTRGKQWFHKSLNTLATENNQWRLTEPHMEKPGFLPPEKRAINSMLEIVFADKDIDHRIAELSTVTFFYRQHPGWQDVTATMEVLSMGPQQRWQRLGIAENVTGYHDHDEMNTQTVALSNAFVRDRLMMRVTLTSGKHFKIMGIAMCA